MTKQIINDLDLDLTPTLTPPHYYIYEHITQSVCTPTLNMASFSTFLVFVLAALILIPQGFATYYKPIKKPPIYKPPIYKPPIIYKPKPPVYKPPYKSPPYEKPPYKKKPPYGKYPPVEDNNHA
ncbi:hypothetical protein V8G54_027541 [Vigna mungo]|uniref:Uncharacterized protein n=1 Tax=Vigna mungo TaxID=3915 RepID=A0AAQ3RP70_VIGMU